MQPDSLMRRPTVWLGLLGAAILLIGAGAALRWRPAPPQRRLTPAFDPVPLSPAPAENASPAASYVGIAACAGCHPNEYRTYRKTAHSLALADVDAAAEPPDGRFAHAASGQTFSVYRADGRLHHRAALPDGAGREEVVADFPLRYLVGSGRHTRSYLIEEDGFLAESPITWYASERAWGMSPGYDRPNHKVFEREVDATCLFCHAGRVAGAEGIYQRLTVVEQPIGCERCHGPGSLHVAEQRVLRDGTSRPGPAPRPTIVHPLHLTRPLTEAICSQCHLNTEVMVNVRGRGLSDFRPGLPLSDFCVAYRYDEGDSPMKVVGHVEQLHRSRCYQESGTLTCTTCHNPHGATPPEEARRRYVKVCLGCHAAEHCRLDRAERLRRSPQDDCVRCHMPQADTEIAHVAFTHHRIGIHTGAAPADAGRPGGRLADLLPWEDVSRFPEIDRERNLGVAYFGASLHQPNPDAADAYRDRAVRLLRGVRSRGLADGEVAAVLARLVREDDPETALDLADEALASERLSPQSQVNSLFLLAEVNLKRDRPTPARKALERLVRMRRRSEDWLLLGTCRQMGGDLAGALGDLKRAVAIAPFRPDLRNRLARLYDQLGEADAARREAALARRLAEREAPEALSRRP